MPQPTLVRSRAIQWPEQLARSGHQSLQREPGVERRLGMCHGGLCLLCRQGGQHLHEMRFRILGICIGKFAPCLLPLPSCDVAYRVALRIMLSDNDTTEKQPNQ